MSSEGRGLCIGGSKGQSVAFGCARRLYEAECRQQDSPAIRQQPSRLWRRRSELRNSFRPQSARKRKEGEKVDQSKFFKLRKQGSRRYQAGQDAKEVARWWYWFRKGQFKKPWALEEEQAVCTHLEEVEERPKRCNGQVNQVNPRECSQKPRSTTWSPGTSAESISTQVFKEKETPGKAPGLFGKHLFSESEQLRFNRFFILSEQEGPCQGGGQLPSIKEEDAQEPTALRTKVRRQHRKGNGLSRAGLQSHRLYQEDPLRKTTWASTLPLPLRHSVGAVAPRKAGACGPSSGPEFAGHSPGGIGPGLECGVATHPRAGSLRASLVGRGSGAVTRGSHLCEVDAGPAEKHRCSAATRKNRPRGFGRQERQWQGQEEWQGWKVRQQGQRQGERVSIQPRCSMSESQAAKPARDNPVLQFARGSWGSFGRFLRLIEKSSSISSEEVGHLTPPSEQGVFSLFPSVLVIPSVMARPGNCMGMGKGALVTIYLFRCRSTVPKLRTAEADFSCTCSMLDPHAC